MSGLARLDAGRAVGSHAALGVAAALALALAAGGCAHGSADPDDPVSQDAPSAPDVRFHDNPLPDQATATLVMPRAGMANVRPHPFAAATPSADGRTLRVTFWGGVAPCFVLDRVELRDAPDAVTVTLYAGSDPTSRDVACIEIAVYMAVDVELSSPLGERVVRDGATEGASRSPGRGRTRAGTYPAFQATDPTARAPSGAFPSSPIAARSLCRMTGACGGCGCGWLRRASRTH